ncbi:hypothetical protein EVJ58_g3550 [Rhodofomes roseus]|uniref:Uncharacterized protein n=1 Tax=Rhodofomes roseus TaxID=34475 RepID=A0A4Y9YLA6_9APHY|nr:hypothetical protein EVJ58_g3550 [Rhodofomes roseus]
MPLSSQASSGSTSSLSERIASMFQSKAKLRARSKLSLAITTATADSSPSTDSTRTWSPVTPTGGFAFPSSSAARVCTQSENGHDTFEEDASKIGRVLTPEPDPFAKADVAIARFSTDVTPRPVSPVANYGSRRGSRQDDRRARKARSAQQGWDFKDTSPDDVGDSPEVYSRVRGSGSLRRVRRRLPAFMMESPSPKSPIYEFPSSCSIYPARGEDAPQSPLLAGPAARTRANLVSRFSMSTESISSRSSFTESAEHQGLKDVDVDRRSSSARRCPVADADIAVAPGNASRSPSKRATLDVCASPKADQPTVCRSTTRASLPTSPPSAHARYAHCAASVLDVTTKRQASVRTSASEPSPRAHRPSSPFPLVRGISDGSPKGHLEAKLDDEMDTSVGSESADDSGVYSGVVVKDEAHRHDEEAFEDSFVLSGEDLERLPIPALSREKRGLAEEHRTFDTEDDALTPRPTSPAQSFLSVDAPSIEQKGPLEELDLTLTVGLAEREWDRHTTGTSGSSTESSMFFSARSSVESTRNSV